MRGIEWRAVLRGSGSGRDGRARWAALTLVWGEPFTAVTAARAQAALRQELALRETAPSASAFRRGIQDIGIQASSCRDSACGLRRRTRTATLARGPEHHRITALPGAGGTVAIAGHRTSTSSRSVNLDRLRPNDRSSSSSRTERSSYVVYGRRIVDDQDWSILRRRSFEKLVLQRPPAAPVRSGSSCSLGEDRAKRADDAADEFTRQSVSLRRNQTRRTFGKRLASLSPCPRSSGAVAAALLHRTRPRR